MQQYDVAVIGLGAMGSAAVFQLAKAGASVLGIDQFKPPHTLGSSHGDSRITRLAVGEGLAYGPLVGRSHQIWRDIEAQTGEDLLTQCGGLVMGVGRDAFVAKTLESAKKYAIPHHRLSTEQIKKRFPQFKITDETGYFEPSAGFVRPEKCIGAQLRLAENYGATLRKNERVVSIKPGANSVRITTDICEYVAKKIIISAGAWLSGLYPEFVDTFRVYRQVVYWFDVAVAEYEQYKQSPVYIWQFGPDKDDHLYGFPAIDGPSGGVKLATVQYVKTTTADDVGRSVKREEIAKMYDNYVKNQFVGLNKKCIKAAACLYTVTSDRQFVIDTHPQYKNVILASPCSGHGFKHSAAIGEVLAQLCAGGKSDIDIQEFNLARLKKVEY